MSLIFQEFISGNVPTSQYVLSTQFMKELAQSHNPEYIQRYLQVYGSQMAPGDIKNLLVSITEYAPEMIPMTDSMARFYDSRSINFLVKTNVDFSGIVRLFNQEQLNQLFIYSLVDLRNDVLNFLYSNGYRPDQPTLDRALVEIFELYSIAPDSKHEEVLKWLVQQGAKFEPGSFDTFLLMRDPRVIQSMLQLGASREELENAMEDIDDPELVEQLKVILQTHL